MITGLAMGAFGVYKSFQLGAALASFAAKMYGGNADVTLAPKGLSAKVRGYFGLAVGFQLLQVKALKGISDWLDNELRSGRVDEGDVNAAGKAVLETFASYEKPTRAAMLAVMRRHQLADELRSAGSEPRSSLLNAGAQRVFDRLLESCIHTLVELVPVGDQRGAEALAVVNEWQVQLTSEIRTDIAHLRRDGQDVAAMLGANGQAVLAEAEAILKTLSSDISSQLAHISDGNDQILAALQDHADPHHLKNPPRDPQRIVDAHSLPRMARYLTAANGDPAEAMRLYQWNRAVSGQLYSAIYIVEVVLRNAMDAQLRRFNLKDLPGTGTPDWLISPTRLLRLLSTPDQAKNEEPPKNRIDAARERAIDAFSKAGLQKEPCHDDIIAQTSLRMWRSFLPTTGRRSTRRNALWREGLSEAFPYLEMHPARLGENVEIILQARNRVAHMEPFLRLNQLRQTEDAIGAVLLAVSPEVAHWHTSTQTLTSLRVHAVTHRLTLD